MKTHASPFVPSLPTAEDLVNVSRNTAARAVETSAARTRFARNAPAMFVYKLSGGAERRIPCRVLRYMGDHPARFLVRLSAPVYGFGAKLEVVVVAERLRRVSPPAAAPRSAR